MHLSARVARAVTFLVAAFGVALAVAPVGCGGNALGTACQTNADCGAGNFCRAGVCTTNCRAQSDCPVGFDCSLGAPGDASGTCHVRIWDTTTTGGFGTDCSLSSVGPDPRISTMPCMPGAPNPCAAGFVCHAEKTCDPHAYCTKDCASDLDCPPSMFCGERHANACSSAASRCAAGFTCQKGRCTRMQCEKREFCSPCAVDDQCAPGYLCATDATGARYCAKQCKSDPTPDSPAGAECPPPQNGFNTGLPAGAPFVACTLDPTPRATPAKVCAPVEGFCHGPSAIRRISGDGNICSPCRADTPGDCAKGLSCFRDEFTSERFCTRGCNVTLSASSGGNYNVVQDDCQSLSPDTYCAFGDINAYRCGAGCQLSGICVADPTYSHSTCHPLER